MNVMYRFGGHFAIVEGPLLVLGLGPPEGRLQGHDPLPFGRQAAFLAVAAAILAVTLVSLQANLEPVVSAAGTVRGRPRVQRVTAGRTAGPVRPAFVSRF